MRCGLLVISTVSYCRGIFISMTQKVSWCPFFFFFKLQRLDYSHCYGLKKNANFSQRTQILSRIWQEQDTTFERCFKSISPLSCLLRLSLLRTKMEWENQVQGQWATGLEPGSGVGSRGTTSSLSFFLFHLHFYESLLKWVLFILLAPETELWGWQRAATQELTWASD